VSMAVVVLVMPAHHSRFAMRVLILLLLLSAACGSPAPAKTAPATATTSSAPPPARVADAAPPLDDCANACTEIAVCWEEENPGRDYNQGGFCVSSCEEGDKKAFFQCVEKGRGDCAAMVQCG
jgi:Cys-rich protein (TIGR04453 family)